MLIIAMACPSHYSDAVMSGIYMVEDMETSYNREYGGGFRAASSFAEYTKPMVCGILLGWLMRRQVRVALPARSQVDGPACAVHDIINSRVG